MNLSNQVKISEAAATTAAGTTEVDGAAINMAGFDGVLFVAKFGTAAAGNQIQAQQATDSGFSDAADLLGTLTTTGASDEIVWLELFQPQEQFVRIQAQRGTSTTLDWAVAIQYGPRKLSIDNTVAGTIAGEIHASPAEGTV